MAHWHNKVSIAHLMDDRDDLTFAQRKTGVAQVLQDFRDAKPWLDKDGELELFIGNVRDSRDVDDFDFAMADVYDWADRDHRLWIDGYR